METKLDLLVTNMTKARAQLHDTFSSLLQTMTMPSGRLTNVAKIAQLGEELQAKFDELDQVVTAAEKELERQHEEIDARTEQELVDLGKESIK